MKKPYTHCKQAADRVKHLFSHYSHFLKQRLHLRPSFHSHHCNLVKLLCLSPKFKPLSLLGYEMHRGRKNLSYPKKVTAGNAGKEKPSFQPAAFPSYGRALKSERIQRWKLKEQMIAARKLKALKGGTSIQVRHSVSIMQDAPDNTQEAAEQREHWEELIRMKEERHFHLTRITKFLMD